MNIFSLFRDQRAFKIECYQQKKKEERAFKIENV